MLTVCQSEMSHWKCPAPSVFTSFNVLAFARESIVHINASVRRSMSGGVITLQRNVLRYLPVRTVETTSRAVLMLSLGAFVVGSVLDLLDMNVGMIPNWNECVNGGRIIQKNIALQRIAGFLIIKSATIVHVEIGGLRKHMGLAWKFTKQNVRSAIIGVMCVVRNAFSRLTTIIKQWLLEDICVITVTGYWVTHLTLQNFFAKPQTIWSGHVH